MLKRMTALTLILTLLIGSIALVPTAAAETYAASTPLSGASDAQLSNIKRACKAIDGCYVPAGSSFSFNETVGPRTKNNGYVSALNGRGAKVVGGGVSQVATTLYLALKKLGGDITFTGLKTYGKKFTENYVDSGDDAVITDYKSGRDLYFTNHGEGFSIELKASKSKLTCTIVTDTDVIDAWDDEIFSFVGGEINGFTNALVASGSIGCTGGGACLTNIALAADSVYDTSLEKGDLFSFNAVVGPRSERYGYVAAKNGRGAKVVGGGTAQVASVIWLAVQNLDDVAIVEKSTYGKRYNQSYVDSSADAILVDYSAGTDFSFRYTGSGCITLYTYLDGSTLYCDVYRS